MVWQAFLPFLLSSVEVRSRSSPPNHYYSYIDNSINNDNDVGATSATPLATELIAPPPPRPQIKKPASLPEFSYMNQQSVSSDNFNNWRPELLNHEDTQTPNTRYHPQHSNNQDPVSNSVRNMEMDPSYSYGYSMHDKSIAQQVDGQGRSSNGYSWSMPDGGSSMFMSGNWLSPAPTTGGYQSKKNNNNFGDKTNTNSVYYPQHPVTSKNNEGYHDQRINSSSNGLAYLMKILGKDSQWIETSDQNGERVGYYSYNNPDGDTILVRYSAGRNGFQVLESQGVPGLSMFG